MPDSPFAITEPDLLPILADLREQEPIFHRPEVASTLAEFAALMAPDYWEVGASGRRYSRAFILEHLAANQPLSATEAGWQATQFSCRRLGPDTFLLTYTLQQGDRHTRRATVWHHRHDGAWEILYHQGTVITGEADDRPPAGSGYTARQP